MKNKTKHLFIHIGTEKTGTTSIQDTLYQNYDILKLKNILYPRAFKMQNHVGFCVSFQNKKSELNAVVQSGTDEESLALYRQQLFNDLNEEIDISGVSRVIISNEHLHSRIMNENELEAIKNWADENFDEVTIICYIRKQVDLALSHYSTQIKSGGVSDTILPDLSNGIPYYYDYKRILSLWSKYFPKIICREFSKNTLLNGNVVEDFLSLFDVQINDIVPSIEHNKSLDGKAMLFLTKLNREFPLVVNGSLNPERKHLVRFFENIPVISKLSISREEEESFQNVFENDNKEISKIYCKKESIFKQKKKVDNRDNIELTIDDSTEIFKHFWKAASKYIRYLEGENKKLIEKSTKK